MPVFLSDVLSGLSGISTVLLFEGRFDRFRCHPQSRSLINSFLLIDTANSVLSGHTRPPRHTFL